jgi:hypothetical protein
MSLPVFDTLDAIPEPFRPEYEEGADQKWYPKAENELAVERKKKAKLLDEKKDAERTKAEVEKERDALKQAADAKEKGISEAELEKIRENEKRARKPIEDELAAIKAENRKLKLTDRVQSLALKAGVMPDRIEDAMLALASRTDLTDGDGIVVKDKAGNVTTEKVEDFLAKTFKTEKPWLYAGTGSSGSGAAGSGGSPAPAGVDTNAIVETQRQVVRSAF